MQNIRLVLSTYVKIHSLILHNNLHSPTKTVVFLFMYYE